MLILHILYLLRSKAKNLGGQAQWFLLILPAIQKQRSGGLWFQSSRGKSQQDSISTNKLGVVMGTWHSSHAGGLDMGNGTLGQSGQKYETLFEKYLKK
jgi:hypothetical protein